MKVEYGMRLGELIEQLTELELKHGSDVLLVMSRDNEGNGYSPLSGLDVGAYVPDTTWSGELKLLPEQLTDELRAKGWSEEDVAGYVEDPEWESADEYEKCISLWPIN